MRVSVSPCRTGYKRVRARMRMFLYLRVGQGAHACVCVRARASVISVWDGVRARACVCVHARLFLHLRFSPCMHERAHMQEGPAAGLTSWMMLETLSQLAGLMFSPPSTRPS